MHFEDEDAAIGDADSGGNSTRDEEEEDESESDEGEGDAGGDREEETDDDSEFKDDRLYGFNWIFALGACIFFIVFLCLDENFLYRCTHAQRGIRFSVELSVLPYMGSFS